jgi:universal stress protein E
MQRFRNTLVGVDLSSGDRLATTELGAPTREAIERATWLAEQTQAELTFFSAIEISAQAEELLRKDANALSETVESAASEVLAELVDNAAKRGVAARDKFVFGRDWFEIVRQVLRDRHDLVVIGTRDLSGPQRLLFGSTGMKLLRKCPCPVWITKPGPVPDVANVLVTSDLSDVSQEALQIVVSGGQLREMKIHLLHACDDQFDRRLRLSGMLDERVEQHRAATRAQAEEELHRQLAQTDYRTLTYGVQVHVVDGPPDVAILNAITEYEVDLLVMGTIGRAGIPGMLIGNTAERLLPQVPCSLLAVKPHEFVSPVTLE